MPWIYAAYVNHTVLPISEVILLCVYGRCVHSIPLTTLGAWHVELHWPLRRTVDIIAR